MPLTPEQIAALELENQTNKEKLAKYEQAEKERANKIAFESTITSLNLSSAGKSLLENSGLTDPEKIKLFVEKNKDNTLLFQETSTNTNTATFVPPSTGEVKPATGHTSETKKGITAKDVNSEDYFSKGFNGISIPRTR